MGGREASQGGWVLERGSGVSCLEEAVRTGEGPQEGRSVGEEDCLPSAHPSVRWGSALGSPRVDDGGARVWGSVMGDVTWGPWSSSPAEPAGPSPVITPRGHSSEKLSRQQEAMVPAPVPTLGLR